MIYLSALEKVSGDLYKVNSINYMPFDEVYGLNKTEDELSKTGILVTELPVKQYDNKIETLYIDKVTKKMHYEYTDAPPTEDEKFEQVNATLSAALLENASDKARIAELEENQSTMLMEIAMLKMNGGML